MAMNDDSQWEQAAAVSLCSLPAGKMLKESRSGDFVFVRFESLINQTRFRYQGKNTFLKNPSFVEVYIDA